MADRKIKDLTEHELIDLIQENIRLNHIEVSGVLVASNKCSLKEVEQTANRLLERHKDFLLLRKENKTKMGFE